MYSIGAYVHTTTCGLTGASVEVYRVTHMRSFNKIEESSLSSPYPKQMRSTAGFYYSSSELHDTGSR